MQKQVRDTVMKNIKNIKYDHHYKPNMYVPYAKDDDNIEKIRNKNS